METSTVQIDPEITLSMKNFIKEKLSKDTTPSMLAIVSISIVRGVNRDALLQKYGDQRIGSRSMTVREFTEGLISYDLAELDSNGVLKMKPSATPEYLKRFRESI